MDWYDLQGKTNVKCSVVDATIFFRWNESTAMSVDVGCQSVQHQAHLWPFAFGPLCQKLLQHICCFHKPLFFSSQSNHKVLVFLVDDLNFRMAFFAYAMNVGLFGPQKFRLEIIFTFIEFKPTTKVPGRMGRKWRRRIHGRCLHFQSLHCRHCSILFGLLSSLTSNRLKAPLSNIKLRQPGKLCLTDVIRKQTWSFFKKKLPQPSLRLKPETIGFLARQKLKWLLTVWVDCKTKEGRKQPNKSLQILPASADLHIFEALKVQAWELSDLQTTSLWPSVQPERQWKHGIALLFAMPLRAGQLKSLSLPDPIALHVPIIFTTGT